METSITVANSDIISLSPKLCVTSGKTTLTFYSKGTYDEWKKQTPNYENWVHKYIKGLGSYEGDASDYKDPHSITFY